MQKQPYIGVTGFMTRDEVEEVLEIVPVSTDRKLMVGVLVSSISMRGLSARCSNRYAAPEKYSEIFSDNHKALNLFHYTTRDQNRILEEMLQLTKLGGKNLHGFQLNLNWPSLNALTEYRKLHPEKTIVLQCGPDALSDFDDVRTFAMKVKEYEGISDYLLIDRSAGEGKDLNPYECLSYLDVLNQMVNGMGFVLAGGLSHLTVNDFIKPVVKIYSGISIDAEGKLCDEYGKLVVEKARRYVFAAYDLFKRF